MSQAIAESTELDRIKSNVVCPVELSLRILGGKWRGSILYQLKDGPLRFTELMHAVQDAVVYYKDDDHWLTSKVLSQHLASLIDFELVEKTNAVTNDDAQHYRLTPKGISVMPLLIELFFWGERNYWLPLGNLEPFSIHSLCFKYIEMKKPWIADILNFFFMGPGYIYNGRRKLLGVIFTIGAFGLTYVELGIQEPMPTLYMIMFGSVLLVNTAFAIDGYREAQDINDKRA